MNVSPLNFVEIVRFPKNKMILCLDVGANNFFPHFFSVCSIPEEASPLGSPAK